MPSIVSIRFHEAARPSQGVIGNSLVLHVKGEGRVLRDLMHVPGKSAGWIMVEHLEGFQKDWCCDKCRMEI